MFTDLSIKECLNINRVLIYFERILLARILYTKLYVTRRPNTVPTVMYVN